MRLTGLAPGSAAHSVRKDLSNGHLSRRLPSFHFHFFFFVLRLPFTIAVQDSSVHLVQMPSVAQKSLILQNPEKPAFQNTRHHPWNTTPLHRNETFSYRHGMGSVFCMRHKDRLPLTR